MQLSFSNVNSLLKRLNFSKIDTPNFEPPNLKGIQIDAYNDFVENRLKEIIASYFPIVSKSGTTTITLEEVVYVSPDITEKEAVEKSKSLQKEIYLRVKLINQYTKNKKTTDTKIFLGHMPEFSSASNFIINGIEKFVISQIVRSPGCYVLAKSQIKLSNMRKRVQEGVICELLPSQGTLILFKFLEDKNFLKIIARNATGENAPQFSATILLKALGITHDSIVDLFKNDSCVMDTLLQEKFNYKEIIQEPSFKAAFKDIVAAKNIQKFLDSQSNTLQQTLYALMASYYEKGGEKIDEMLSKLSTLSLQDNKYDPKELKQQIDKEIQKCSSILELISIELAAKYFVSELEINADISKSDVKSYQQLIWSYFFDKQYYDILPAGRYKINHKLCLSQRIFKKYIAQDVLDVDGNVVFPKNTFMDAAKIDQFSQLAKQKKLKIVKKINIKPANTSGIIHEKLKNIVCEEISIYLRGIGSPIVKLIGTEFMGDDESVTPSDFLAIFSYLMHLRNKIGNYDDIDHLGNKRLRLVSELLEARIALAMFRINKFTIEKMNNLEARVNYFSLKNTSPESLFTVYAILNTKPFQIVIKEFFNSHQLTQFLDQQNPLSELTNKRKISAMGPGGIKREDPNLNIRDVHFSHYGRICPIETPEGMNIGLIMALASFAKIDKYGFLNTPFYKVNNTKITDEVHWLNAMEENKFITVEAISPRDKNNCLLSPVTARSCEHVESIDAANVDYIDVSCNQLVSISASLIPFLEHDDANRALMGSNMQRQAVPLLKPYSPIVGTGVEHRISCDSEVALLAKDDGVVESVDGRGLTISYKNEKLGKENIDLMKFVRSNQNTCKNQTPTVRPKQTVKKNDILVNGHAMQNGELALGQNVLIAFSTWHGYNFEDAIVLSSRLYQEDVYTSVHIQEYTCECLRTKIGDEEITRQIPGCLNETKKYLDQDGLIIVGAKVKEGDILVGKIAPKANTDQTPEEKLLQAIFSEKARSVKDASLYVPTGGEGIVTKVLRFSIYKGDKLNDDVIEVVKVFIAQKRKIQVGDKMAGRHGNKGIVAKIASVADMPYMADGTPIDILLNPLGVPSRMNIGQVLETYLGFASRNLVIKKLMSLYFEKNIDEAVKVFGLHIKDIEKLFNVVENYLKNKKINSLDAALKEIKQIDLAIILSQAGLKQDDVDIKSLTPIFSGCKHEDLVAVMKEAGLNPDKDNGKYELFDGRTGEKFKKPIAVGIMYMLKLDHMVDDKIYARSVGPYSKITQQPLGGKCQNGGQRFGEMEVWAMEAYGAAYNLQELLTLKSDDIHSRNLIYYSIIKGQKLPTPNIPESFKLLVKQLQGAGLKINIQYGDNSELISCNEFIEKQLNRSSDYVLDKDYQENLSAQLNKMIEGDGDNNLNTVKSKESIEDIE